ncbi:hypothetical protein CUJ83_11275 [Methanocella sp. CWC-04]|uniref:Uncharacterized protein n=1 Tax=Methanooceanicella nereidis TaxID=2052831 RepID=A0AAP2RFD7_9EURY|nr:MTH865 family protein [Methanocella sp. CWC-04]MCD1295580.1 hypothetical protein [Methanocella sp. CWC-04]
MSIEKPNYSEHAEAPGATSIKELEMMKLEIVSLMTGANVRFPIDTREELLKVFPKATPMACQKGDRLLTMYDLICNLDNNDFPIKSAGDAASLLTARCPL